MLPSLGLESSLSKILELSEVIVLWHGEIVLKLIAIYM